ncbi:Cardioacceleratory peptide receptor [Echinococcus granulosus]|nr:Cardioacceleratory peptide receptor [Echinococcus granulosus]
MFLAPLDISSNASIWGVDTTRTRASDAPFLVYLTSVAVTVFILPALFITVCHVVMVVRIWQAAANTEQSLTVPINQPAQVKRLRHAIDSVCHECPTVLANNDSTSRPCNKTGFRHAAPIQMKTSPGCIPRARIKTVKMTLVIVSVYIICWCPYMIYNLLITYRVIGPHTPNLMAISPLIQHLVTLNSSTNPVVFWMFSAHTIITERRKNRRSKVVQRYHRRWKCNSRKRMWHDHSDCNEEMMMKTRQNDRHFNQPRIPNASNSNQRESEKTRVSVDVEVS